MVFKKVNALLVDDDASVRSSLRLLLSRHRKIRITAEAESAEDALKMIQKNRPDALFLDIHMKGMSGLEMLRQLQNPPLVVFITAYGQHALEAHRFHPVDYLLKPFSPQRLEESIDQLSERVSLLRSARPEQTKNRLLTVDGYAGLIRADTICWVRSVGLYSEIKTEEGELFLTKASLERWEKHLERDGFIRLNNKMLVASRLIQRIVPTGNRGGHAVIKGLLEPEKVSSKNIARIKSLLTV
jgi:DNA-binding LytR/AlgR family response regulator